MMGEWEMKERAGASGRVEKILGSKDTTRELMEVKGQIHTRKESQQRKSESQVPEQS